MLLLRGVHPDLMCMQGRTPLMVACQYGYKEVATILLSTAASKLQLNKCTTGTDHWGLYDVVGYI